MESNVYAFVVVLMCVFDESSFLTMICLFQKSMLNLFMILSVSLLITRLHIRKLTFNFKEKKNNYQIIKF